MKFQLPRSTQNWITLIGATIALIALFMIAFGFAMSILWKPGHAYIGLVLYILLPAFMILGLILIPIGMLFQIWRDRKLKMMERPPWPRVDLNDPRHRNAFFIFSIGTTTLLFMSAIGSYEAFHFTESVTFCGTLCHQVMYPEHKAYQHSPHARVKCVSCHVGPGANWYVRSKLSGVYQVYAVLSHVYPQPIPTPIENLRPARETCEECHWPEKFYAQKLRMESHYLPDQKNTQWNIYLIMKIGAEHPALGLREGIHWHINPDVRVEYIATDEEREKLPWVRYTNLKTGEQVTYQDQDAPLSAEEIKKRESRVMDCMDCHNRPSHLYRPPAFFVNDAMKAGEIPTELPEIKSLAMKICGNEFKTTEEAMKAIEMEIHRFYKEAYPDIYESKRKLVEESVKGLQQAFSENIFPEMKVRWSAYPNQIGHIEFNGCFRCHNDRHKSQEGKVIRKNCDQCHIISAQGSPENMEIAELNQALEFKHPEDIGDAWKEMLCTECHTGLNP
ncbi:MAG: NapC/NirT family cytochrome c [Acidobacteriota bacterium]